MTLLPSLFESRIPSLFRRDRYNGIEEMMDNFINQFPTAVASGNGKRIVLDVEELDDKYVVQAEVPGVAKKDIDVTLQDRVLTIQYSQESEKEEKSNNCLCKERWQGAASRSVMLPHAAGNKDVDAALKDGVLTVTIKKELAETTKRIAIH